MTTRASHKSKLLSSSRLVAWNGRLSDCKIPDRCEAWQSTCMHRNATLKVEQEEATLRFRTGNPDGGSAREILTVTCIQAPREWPKRLHGNMHPGSSRVAEEATQEAKAHAGRIHHHGGPCQETGTRCTCLFIGRVAAMLLRALHRQLQFLTCFRVAC